MVNGGLTLKLYAYLQIDNKGVVFKERDFQRGKTMNAVKPTDPTQIQAIAQGIAKAGFDAGMSSKKVGEAVKAATKTDDKDKDKQQDTAVFSLVQLSPAKATTVSMTVSGNSNSRVNLSRAWDAAKSFISQAGNQGNQTKSSTPSGQASLFDIRFA